MATIVLDVCTPEGNTWLARVTGSDKKFGVKRQFVNAVSSDLSKSGKTGSKTYLVDDGIYQSNEGRRRLGRRWWKVEGDQAAEVSEDEGLAAVKEMEA